MCKAKQRIQDAHGYRPSAGQPMPEPGTFVTTFDIHRNVLVAELRGCNPIGIIIMDDGKQLFIPWSAIISVQWEIEEETHDGPGDEPNATNRPGLVR